VDVRIRDRAKGLVAHLHIHSRVDLGFAIPVGEIYYKLDKDN
jgi:hypothetical protein